MLVSVSKNKKAQGKLALLMLIKFTKIDPYQEYYTFNTSKGAPSKTTTLVILDLRIIIPKTDPYENKDRFY